MMGMAAGYMQQPQMMGQDFMLGGGVQGLSQPGLYGQGLGMP